MAQTISTQTVFQAQLSLNNSFSLQHLLIYGFNELGFLDVYLCTVNVCYVLYYLHISRSTQVLEQCIQYLTGLLGTTALKATTGRQTIKNFWASSSIPKCLRRHFSFRL